jgi:hypothetical protein
MLVTCQVKCTPQKCSIILFYFILFIPLSLRTEHRASKVPRLPRILFQFLGSIRHLVRLLGGGISPAHGLYLHRTTQHRRRQTSMPQAEFETAIPMFERPKTVLALDCSATETGPKVRYHNVIPFSMLVLLKSKWTKFQVQ